MKPSKVYITIGGIQYYTTKDTINKICLSCGFDGVKYQNENISGRIRAGYFKATFRNSFRSFADKIRASKLVKIELNKLEVI